MKGLTLVEVLVAGGITAMVSALLITILVNTTGLFYQQTTKVSQGVGANDALSQFRASLKEAKAVAVSYPETGTPSYTSGGSQLVLKFSSIDASGYVIANTYDYIVFYLSGDKFKIATFKSGASQRKLINRILASSVTGVTFSYLDAQGQAVTPSSAVKVRMSLSLNQKAGKLYVTNTATSEANLRND